eukprot:gene18054-19863_t
MDIKDLLNLAKDNQSYNQKKFDRDQHLKNKNKNQSNVSSTAVQAFLAKKKQVEDKAKAAEEAARRLRIQQRLQVSQQDSKAKQPTSASNKNNPSRSDTSANAGISGRKKPVHQESPKQNQKHLRTDSTAHRIPKISRSGAEKEKSAGKGARDGHHGAAPSGKGSAKVDFKDLMKVAKGQIERKPELPGKTEFKQHKRKRGADTFEWSGSKGSLESKMDGRRTQQKSDFIARKGGEMSHKNGEKGARRQAAEVASKTGAGRGRPADSRQLKGAITANTKKVMTSAAPAVNFKDLLSVAKQQANKPVTVVADRREKVATKRQAGGIGTKQQVQGIGVVDRKSQDRNPEGRKKQQVHPAGGVARKQKYVDINSINASNGGLGNVSRRPKEQQQQAGLAKSGGCKLVTRTIDNKRNYEFQEPVAMSSSQQWRGMGSRGDANFSDGRKRTKSISIDDELERERKELERKRNALKRKMQGLPSGGDELSEFSEYSEDDYDDYDDMADFIDDGGDDMDYSKHIRNIFGYDRRKFHDEDDDLSAMESNYRQIAAEESRSARIAKLEDEIEKRREEMELRKAKKRR